MLSRVYIETILQQYFNLQGKIKLVLDCRKGFIKLALRCPTKNIKSSSLLYFLPQDVDEEIIQVWCWSGANVYLWREQSLRSGALVFPIFELVTAGENHKNFKSFIRIFTLTSLVNLRETSKNAKDVGLLPSRLILPDWYFIPAMPGCRNIWYWILECA